MRFSIEEDNSETVAKKSTKKSEVKKEVTVAFQSNLKKIEEADETPSKSSEDRKGISNTTETTGRKNERPQSARGLPRRGLERGFRKRPKSTETFGNETRKRDSVLETKRRLKEMFDIREMYCRGGVGCEYATLLDLESRCSSAYGCRARSCLCDYETDLWTSYNHYKASVPKKRSKSNSSFPKTIFEKEKDLHKMKRSLRLIGLELSDFGVYSNGDMETIPRCKLKRKSSTFSTKVTGRSFSLESLRHAIRRAWLEDCLDESHRKLLSRAAYEEWYFKKEKELQEKQKKEKQRKAILKENQQKDFERKKAESEEEFRKWMQRKRIKRRENEKNLEKRSEHRFGRVKKTKQDTEAAFSRWKKEKDKELEKKKKEKKKEEEKKMESERQKHEKKIIAEKAFQQWKTKLEENEKLKGQKRIKLKKKQEELERRQKQEEGSQISFQVWKEAKDEEIRQRMKHIREITKLEREERQARTEERMYEAEMAFEDWLEKIDSRKQKQFCDNFQRMPWIPT